MWRLNPDTGTWALLSRCAATSRHVLQRLQFLVAVVFICLGDTTVNRVLWVSECNAMSLLNPDNRWSGSRGADSDANETHPPRPPRQDLRHALGLGLQVSAWSRSGGAVISLVTWHNHQCWLPFQMNTYDVCPHRLLVSASQDGKLIIWDSYTTNKVRQLPFRVKAASFASVALTWPVIGLTSAALDPRHPSALLLGDDLRVRPLRELRGLRGPRQHLLHLLLEDAWRQRQGQQGTPGPYRWRTLLQTKPESPKFDSIWTNRWEIQTRDNSWTSEQWRIPSLGVIKSRPAQAEADC